ncbi:MAG: flavin reductase [Stenotrophobium sp.]
MTQDTAFDTRNFRSALGNFATGVTIITTRCDDGSPVGITANSFNSVSLEPPMVLWSLAKNSRSLPAFDAAKHWAVHILAANQEALSNRFAKSGADKFAGLDTAIGIGGSPLLDGCATRLQCSTAFRYEGGDHIIFVGRVLGFDHNPVAPLVFHGGSYAVATRKTNSVTASRSESRHPAAGWSEDNLAYLLGRAYFQLYGRIHKLVRLSGLSDLQYFTLATLILRDRQTLAGINQVFAYSGMQVTPDVVHALAEHGWLYSDGSGDNARHMLTDQGRQLTLRMIAAAEAVEADVLGEFGEFEALSLRNLLRSFIRQTDPGLPDLWSDAQSAG